ncbi:hypothetical protein AVEN_217951-1 [Araneus ventricosus]|uniref:Uncharacterized protein n=1 Tax=Araneus ventricosus TaxID=182803 RepID=A0A4Y2UDL7_ARAVE|nr:hypothetical protein AVEN_217951-1 [Araneus ventricosus]
MGAAQRQIIRNGAVQRQIIRNGAVQRQIIRSGAVQRQINGRKFGHVAPPVDVAWKPGEGESAQASSWSSDRGSKLRGPSPNSRRVASKRDVNLI